MTQHKEYSSEFNKIVEGYIEGVDYIIVGEQEAYTDAGETRHYDFDFTDWEISAHSKGVKFGFNGGVYAAFDAQSHTLIATQRNDMLRKYKSNGLYVPFSNNTLPADPMKAAAFIYQEEMNEYKTDTLSGLKDYSDVVAFLKAALPMVEAQEEKAHITHLIEKFAYYSVDSHGYQKGRNDYRASYDEGQKLLISLREKLDKKEMQALALKYIKWENELGSPNHETNSAKKTQKAKARENTLLAILGARSIGKKNKALEVAQEFHETNPDQRTALTFKQLDKKKQHS